ncbi:hypothetical protein [uncultured Cellulomonas sp.]|uniref:hypothetical protein n=1 Tax=uncultured Cellulomonas sp. TaxID=189682 RepID=UPI00262F9BD0|nr:hypothetical protein [uncultured Cellulomonas sp.]
MAPVWGFTSHSEGARCATRCTCIRDQRLIQVVLDPTCPAWTLHASTIIRADG